MPRVGFAPTIQVFERANTFRAFDGAATLIGRREAYTSFNNAINQRNMLVTGVNISAVIDLCDVCRPTNESDLFPTREK
jgi:hypothetical protein